jgi:replicative DNA helicase
VQLVPKPLADDFRQATGTTLAAYLAGCVTATTYEPSNSRNAAAAVVTQWARLSLGGEARAAVAASSDPTADPLLIARTMSANLDEVTSHLRRGRRSRTLLRISDAASAAMAAAREARGRRGLSGITTGLVDLDRATGGFQRRDLIVIAARPAMGKTTLATSLSKAAARSGVGVGLFSLEMDNAKLGARYASDIAHDAGVFVPYRDIIAGTIDDHQEAAIEAALAEYASLPFWTEDQSGLTMPELRAKTENMLALAEEAGTPLGMLLVDHLTKIRPSARYAGNRANEVAEVTDGLKELAREHDLAVVLLSQLNRGVEGRDDKHPQLMDLRDSGAIEQDADMVAFLYREAYYLEMARPDSFDKRMDWEADLHAVRHKGELAIAKQRNGPTTTIDLYMDVACSAVRNAAREGTDG